MGVYNPRVGFGLQAMALAVRARLGGADGAMVTDLRRACDRLLGGDAAVFAAIDRFAADMASDQPAAGAALLDFLADWTGPAARAQSAARAWQDRKDCGHG